MEVWSALKRLIRLFVAMIWEVKKGKDMLFGFHEVAAITRGVVGSSTKALELLWGRK